MKFKIGDYVTLSQNYGEFKKNKKYKVRNSIHDERLVINPFNDDNGIGHYITHYPLSTYLKKFNAAPKDEIDYYRWLSDRMK